MLHIRGGPPEQPTVGTVLAPVPILETDGRGSDCQLGHPILGADEVGSPNVPLQVDNSGGGGTTPPPVGCTGANGTDVSIPDAEQR